MDRAENSGRCMDHNPQQELERFIEYKDEDAGNIVVYVNPKHTSQRCSKCGHVNKNKKHELEFKCRKRNFKLKANLKA